MKRVYVAGPFRGRNHWDQENNIRSAEAWALELYKQGVAPYCSHSQTRFFTGTLPDQIFLDADIEWLLHCDAVFMLSTWRNSPGARHEHEVAIAHNIPVFEDFGALCAWIQIEKENEQDQTSVKQGA